ncbi:MAG: hypothetical protein P8Y53_13850 [Pseudolabrys sp.]|jgi:hypothetical protein
MSRSAEPKGRVGIVGSACQPRVPIPIQDLRWNSSHASAFTQTHGFVRWAVATPRAHGAMRYRCPLTGSYVHITDEPTLAALSRPPARINCPDCGEQHLMTVETAEADEAADIAAAPRRL